MISTVDTQDVVENLFLSYETQIQCVDAFFQTAQKVLQEFNGSSLDLNQEREEISGLKENLAKTGSLRKKDFDKMMAQLAAHQDQQEQELKNLSKDYLSEQTGFVDQLKENLANFKEALAEREIPKIKEFHARITEILSEQERQKNEIVAKLKEVQKDRAVTDKMLKDLSAKGNELKVRDLKSMLKEFKFNHANRKQKPLVQLQAANFG